MSKKLIHLSPQEVIDVTRWLAGHALRCPEGVSGGVYFNFSRTSGIGLAIEVKCACGAEENVTDYASW